MKELENINGQVIPNVCDIYSQIACLYQTYTFMLTKKIWYLNNDIGNNKQIAMGVLIIWCCNFRSNLWVKIMYIYIYIIYIDDPVLYRVCIAYLHYKLKKTPQGCMYAQLYFTGTQKPLTIYW